MQMKTKLASSSMKMGGLLNLTGQGRICTALNRNDFAWLLIFHNLQNRTHSLRIRSAICFEQCSFPLDLFLIVRTIFQGLARQYPVSLVWWAVWPGKTVTGLQAALWPDSRGATCDHWSPSWCFLTSLVNCLLWGEEQMTANMRISYQDLPVNGGTNSGASWMWTVYQATSWDFIDWWRIWAS